MSAKTLLLLTLTPGLSVVDVLLLPGPAVLEPDLRHPLGEPRDLCDALEVLAVGVRVDLEVGLQDLDLLLGEGRAHALSLLLARRLVLAALCKAENPPLYLRSCNCVWNDFLGWTVPSFYQIMKEHLRYVCS